MSMTKDWAFNEGLFDETDTRYGDLPEWFESEEDEREFQAAQIRKESDDPTPLMCELDSSEYELIEGVMVESKLWWEQMSERDDQFAYEKESATL